MKETYVRNGIKKYVESLGGVCSKVFCGRGQLKYGGYISGAEPGTHDLIACIPVEVTPEMVGSKIGLYVSIEVKKDESEVNKWLRYDEDKLPTNKSQERIYNQKAFARKVRNAGGISCCTCSMLGVRKSLSQKEPEQLK